MIFDFANVELEVLKEVDEDGLQAEHIHLWPAGAVSLQMQEQVFMLDDVLLYLSLGLILGMVKQLAPHVEQVSKNILYRVDHVAVSMVVLLVARLTQVHLFMHAVEVGYLVQVEVFLRLVVHARFLVCLGVQKLIMLELHNRLILFFIKLCLRNLLHIVLVGNLSNVLVLILVEPCFDLHGIE